MAAIQDQLPNNHCYGCGADNSDGLQIKSHWRGDECASRTPGATSFDYCICRSYAKRERSMTNA